MTWKTPGRGKGLLTSLTDLTTTLVAIAHTRLELLCVELEQEREHIFSLLVMTLAALFCLGVGMVLVVIMVVIAYWDTHRILALGTIAGLFLAAGIVVCVCVMHKLKNKPGLLAASLSELSKDRQQLISRT